MKRPIAAGIAEKLADPDHPGAISGFFPGQCFGLGFAMRTKTGEPGIPSSVGEYSWAGYAGRLFWVDPAKEIIAIYMANIAGEVRGVPRNHNRPQPRHRRSTFLGRILVCEDDASAKMTRCDRQVVPTTMLMSAPGHERRPRR